MFTALVCLALAAPTDPPKDKELPEAAKKELKKLEGKWKVTKEITSNGENEMAALGRGDEVTVEFKGNKVIIAAKEKFEFEVSTLDGTVDPKILDLKALADKGPITKGSVIEAIYKFDGDTLILVGYAGEGKKRPANFDPPKDEGVGMWVMKKVKE
jgi:uncharacterized protein (TIGR03067 family)